MRGDRQLFGLSEVLPEDYKLMAIFWGDQIYLHNWNKRSIDSEYSNKMWHQISTQGWAAGMLALASSFAWLPTTTAAYAPAAPAAPKLSFLYTAFVECEGNLMDTTVGPHGQRKAIPIVGGNFSGPHLSGTSILSCQRWY
jgi:hypothetical protein